MKVEPYTPEGGKAFKDAVELATEKVAASELAEREAADPYVYAKAKERLEALQRQDSGEDLEPRSKSRLDRYINTVNDAQKRLEEGTPQSDDETFVQAYTDVFGPYINQQEARYAEAEEAAKLEDVLNEPAPFTEEDEQQWLELRNNPMRDAGQQFEFRQLDKHFGPIELARTAAGGTETLPPEPAEPLAAEPETPAPAGAEPIPVVATITEPAPISPTPKAQAELDRLLSESTGVAPETTTDEVSPAEEDGEPPIENPEPPEPGETEDEKLARKAKEAATLAEEAPIDEHFFGQTEAEIEAEKAKGRAEMAAAVAGARARETAAAAATPAAAPLPDRLNTALNRVARGIDQVAARVEDVTASTLESVRNGARNLRDRLVNNFDRYKDHPGEILKDGKNALEFGVKAWWNGIKPVDFFSPDPEKKYLAQYKWKNVLAYLGGAAAGAAVDITAILPGLGVLRPAARILLASGLALAMGWSETREKRQIEKLSMSEEEKVARFLEMEEKHKKTSTLVTNLTRGMVAGMMMGGIVQTFGIDKAGQDFVNNLLKPEPQEAPAEVGFMPKAEQPITPPAQPEVVEPAAPAAPEGAALVPDAGVTEAATPQDIIFKVPEAGADSVRGFWGADFSALGEAAHDWGIPAAAGSDKTAILGMIVRQNAGEFGFPGDTLSYSKLGENSLKLIKLLGESKSQTDFLANGGQNLINLVNAGQT